MADLNNKQENLSEEVEKIDKEVAIEAVDYNEIEAEEEKTNKVSFSDALISTIVDVLIAGAISVAGLYIFDIILRLAAGYYVSDKISAFAIIYIIVTILYTTIMESSRSANTIGKKAANLKVIKTK